MNWSSTLSPERRARDLAALAAGALDVLVVGGGVTGAGIALDAATRGLSVGVVDAQDWAAGTSSRSSKLVHGGLRYLAMLDFRLVHEALRERALLLGRLAPHLVRPVPILYPLRSQAERAYAGAGIALYDAMGWTMTDGAWGTSGTGPSTSQGGRLPRHRHLDRRQTLGLAPGLRPGAVAGGIVYYDAQLDDARFVVELVRTAAAYGAVPVSRALATGFLLDAGRVTGARLRDTENGAEHEVRARVTVLATGPWTEETEALAGYGRAMQVRPSKGVHLMVPRQRLASAAGLILRTANSVLFVLPWGDHWLIGTTDTDWAYPKARPLATAGDIDYLLGELNAVLADPLSAGDVTAVYAGLRPLVAGAGVVRGPGEGRAVAGATAKLSREHAIGRPAPGLVVVSGGKYTTYRVMAADAMDAAVAVGGLHALECRTSRVALLGARPGALRPPGVPAEQWERLHRRYGSLAAEVLAPAAADASLAEPLRGGAGYTGAEILYAVTHEGARHLDDVLSRRTRAAIESDDGAMAAAPQAVALMAPLLGWGPTAVAAELDDWQRQAALRERSAGVADDAAADELAGAVAPLLPLP